MHNARLFLFHMIAVIETFQMKTTVNEEKGESFARRYAADMRLALRFADIEKNFPLTL